MTALAGAAGLLVTRLPLPRGGRWERTNHRGETVSLTGGLAAAAGALVGAAFAPAVQFARWLAPVAAIKGILQGLDSYVKGRGKPLVAIRCRIAAAALMIAVTWLLYDEWGALSVAIGALAGQVLCLIWLSAIVYADVSGQDPQSPEDADDDDAPISTAS